MIEIKPQKIRNCEISVPGSKSYTHRALLAASLSDGQCIIDNALQSEDTIYTLKALKQLGITIEIHDNKFIVNGSRGIFSPCSEPIYLGNSGTSIRLLTGIVAIGSGIYTLTGVERMKDRPIQDLIDGLNQIGVKAKALNNGCPPVEVLGSKVKGGQIFLNCKVSSQYLSSLLLMSPYTIEGLDIQITEGLVSRPYIDITIDVMDKFGVKVDREGYERFIINGSQLYKAINYFVEPDCSNASYFWAAAAITGATVKVKGISKKTCQGDIRFLEILKALGCSITEDNDGISVTGGRLTGIECDMSDMPDIVPTLAVIAAFAKGMTVIKNVEHLKVKESNRLTSVINELNKMGIYTEYIEKNLIVIGGNPTGSTIETYNDHRMAMSFAVAGLVVPDMKIKDENCVEKSFPSFWTVFERFYK